MPNCHGSLLHQWSPLRPFLSLPPIPVAPSRPAYLFPHATSTILHSVHKLLMATEGRMLSMTMLIRCVLPVPLTITTTTAGTDDGDD